MLCFLVLAGRALLPLMVTACQDQPRNQVVLLGLNCFSDHTMLTCAWSVPHDDETELPITVYILPKQRRRPRRVIAAIVGWTDQWTDGMSMRADGVLLVATINRWLCVYDTVGSRM